MKVAKGERKHIKDAAVLDYNPRKVWLQQSICKGYIIGVETAPGVYEEQHFSRTLGLLATSIGPRHHPRPPGRG